MYILYIKGLICSLSLQFGTISDIDGPLISSHQQKIRNCNFLSMANKDLSLNTSIALNL
jgi:hypothetical protein